MPVSKKGQSKHSESAKFARFVNVAYSESTRKIYQHDIRHFEACGGTIPSNPEAIATYLSELAGSYAGSTLSRKLAALHKAHVAFNYESPVSSELVQATLRGINRTFYRPQRQVKPLLRSHLEAILVHMHGLKGLRDRALLLLGFFGGFRRSELINIEVEDIKKYESGMVIRLKHSKTDQVGAGRDVPIPKLESELCSVTAVSEWLKAANIKRGPIFRRVNRHNAVGSFKITAHVVASLVKNYVDKIGLDSKEYSGHSLRAGLVTSAAMAGAKEWQIRQQTGHKSTEMVDRYIRQSEMFTGNVAALIVNDDSR